jgi:hypothetical protein
VSAHPVFVTVQGNDGTTSQVRVGTAYKDGENFRLELGQLTIGGTPVAAPAARSAPASSAGRGGGMVFPNYGRSKGQPIAGATVGDLEFYLGGCRRTLDDPGKARFHDKERELMAAIEAEMVRQQAGGGSAPARSAPSSSSRGMPTDEESPPPLSDDEIPF